MVTLPKGVQTPVAGTSAGQTVPDDALFPQFHICADAGEAYGAAWIATKEHIVEGKF